MRENKELVQPEKEIIGTVEMMIETIQDKIKKTETAPVIKIEDMVAVIVRTGHNTKNRKEIMMMISSTSNKPKSKMH